MISIWADNISKRVNDIPITTPFSLALVQADSVQLSLFFEIAINLMAVHGLDEVVIVDLVESEEDFVVL